MLRAAAFLLLVLVTSACQTMSAKAELAHDVYFELLDASPEKQRELIDSCYELLAPTEGVAFCAAGARDEELARDVNDRAFHVALHVYFTTRAAHDAYQDHPQHLAFLAANKDNWKSVRVFDAEVRAR